MLEFSPYQHSYLNFHFTTRLISIQQLFTNLFYYITYLKYRQYFLTNFVKFVKFSFSNKKTPATLIIDECLAH